MRIANAIPVEVSQESAYYEGAAPQTGAAGGMLGWQESRMCWTWLSTGN